MELELYQIDAFTNKVFAGNPACVVPLKEWLPDDILLNIAQENAVAETAFFIENGDKFHLRWFTPEIEMDLCGHATLASAHCLKTILHHSADEFVFESKSGKLKVSVNNDWYSMDLPSRPPQQAELPDSIFAAFSIKPQAVFKSRDYLLLYETEEDIRAIQIDRQTFDQVNIDPGGVIVTAKGNHVDFVSRFFTPQASIMEDPVTGSAHCTLIPFWAKKLGKKELSAMQLSKRVGHLDCIDNGDRVIVKGQAVTYSTGRITLN